MRAVVYTRVGCHLCDDAIQMLTDRGLNVDTVDIDADSALRDEFDQCVPVVKIDGKIRFRGKVNQVLLERLLDRDPSEISGE